MDDGRNAHESAPHLRDRPQISVAPAGFAVLINGKFLATGKLLEILRSTSFDVNARRRLEGKKDIFSGLRLAVTRPQCRICVRMMQ
jgi:hypothetical protein